MTEEMKLKEDLKKLLHAIQDGDTEIYREMATDDLTCIEPETRGVSVDGLPFHIFFMENKDSTSPYHLEIVKPTIKVFDDFAYATYSLLITRFDEHGSPIIKKADETRIFRKIDGNWKMIHFHRS